MPKYIDADALYSDFEHCLWFDNRDRDDVAEQLLLEAPAADVEPVKRGEWMQKHHIISFNNMTLTGTYPTCSLCGYAEVGMAKKSNYCPNCGAYMRGEGAE